MSENRHRCRTGQLIWFLGGLAWLAAAATLLLPGASPAAPSAALSSEKAPHVIISGEFFSALEKLTGSGVVTGDRQEQLLEQIALTQRFIVKTNLTLVEQNERLIRLLEEINRRRPQGGP